MARKLPKVELIDPATLMKIHSLEFRSKFVVEGFCQGFNRSPFHGFSVEFTEYRQYTPGDDLRYLDWKLYARSDRDYIKRFEDETNLRCHLLLDCSRSMEFGSLSYTKLEYAKTFAATFAYFLLRQHDAVGLISFDDTVREFLPARAKMGQFRRLVAALHSAQNGGGTNYANPLERIAKQNLKRGLFILISDMLTPLDDLDQKLGFLRARGHEVILFQLLDPAEIDFTFDNAAIFEDLESKREVYVDPKTFAKQYKEAMAEHLASLEGICNELGIAYHLFSTDDPLENALAAYLSDRSRMLQTPMRVSHRSRRKAA